MCGCVGALHWGGWSPTTVAFQLARRERVLERDIFRFGTARVLFSSSAGGRLGAHALQCRPGVDHIVLVVRVVRGAYTRVVAQPGRSSPAHRLGSGVGTTVSRTGSPGRSGVLSHILLGASSSPTSGGGPLDRQHTRTSSWNRRRPLVTGSRHRTHAPVAIARAEPVTRDALDDRPAADRARSGLPRRRAMTSVPEFGWCRDLACQLGHRSRVGGRPPGVQHPEDRGSSRLADALPLLSRGVVRPVRTDMGRRTRLPEQGNVPTPPPAHDSRSSTRLTSAMTRSPRSLASRGWSPARCTTTCPITSDRQVPGQMASVKSTKLEVGTRRGDDDDEDRGWQQATGTSREESGPRRCRSPSSRTRRPVMREARGRRRRRPREATTVGAARRGRP